jgi:hypothetical protein
VIIRLRACERGESQVFHENGRTVSLWAHISSHFFVGLAKVVSHPWNGPLRGRLCESGMIL